MEYRANDGSEEMGGLSWPSDEQRRAVQLHACGTFAMLSNLVVNFWMPRRYSSEDERGEIQEPEIRRGASDVPGGDSW